MSDPSEILHDEISQKAKVLKANDYTGYLVVQKTLEEAHQQAEQIVESAQNVYETEKRRGYQDGLNAAKIESAAHMLESVSQTLDYLERIENDLVDVVTRALKRIVGELDWETQVVNAVRKGLKPLCHQQRITLRAAPTVAARLEELLPDAFPEINVLNIVADDRMEEGDCLLESEIGITNVSIEGQIQALRNMMKGRIGGAE